MFGLKATDELSANEIAAAREVDVDRLNVQHQDKIRWTPSFAVVRSSVDQLERSGDLDGRLLDRVNDGIDRAERFDDRGLEIAAKAQPARGRVAGPREPATRICARRCIDLAREL